MKIIVSILMINFSAHANNFNGYIAKLINPNKSIQTLRNIKIQESIFTEFGVYYHIQGDKKDIKQLMKKDNIKFIEPNWIIKINEIKKMTQNSYAVDSQFGKQWGFKNTGKNSGRILRRGKSGEDVNALRAWNIQKGNKDVVIAIIDTGIDYKHKDLKDNIWTNEAEKNGIKGVDDDGNGYIDDIHGYDFINNDGDPKDDYSHGTHCAGNIGAAHNGKGMMGMMANVSLMALKFLSRKGEGDVIGALKSINYAIQNGAHILSNSWGMYAFSRTLKQAIQAARDKNILFVASAGNNSSNNDEFEVFPARYKVENVIAVGAMSANGKKAKFSNFGHKTVHIFAPGEDIYSTMINNRYKSKSGTSMAAPIVAGALGLLLANEPNISYQDAKKRLIESSVNKNIYMNYSQGGRLDTYRLLKNIID